MNPVRVLLLGGHGYIGQAIAARLHGQGHDVHTIKRGIELDARADANVHGGGMENIEALRHLLPEADVVVHLASATTPGLSRTSPFLEASLNIGPTLAVIEEMQRYPAVRLVYLSSGGAMYGSQDDAGATEATPPQPQSYYGAGKLAIEGFLRCLEHLAGNPITILRPSNVYGPGQPRYHGFAVIRTMLQHVVDGTTMSFWGDGSVVRDFIHIDDMTSAIECVISDPAASGTFNVGSGIGHSLNDLRTLIERVTGKALHVNYEPSRSIDVKRIVLDSNAMRERFGWAPAIPLSEGIENTWRWLCAQ